MAIDEEKLIMLVNQYPEIYDLQNEHYMNSTRKNNIWKEIAEEIGAKDIICKEKWKSLRDSYHRYLKKRKGKSGDGATRNKKWKFENQLNFLQPYLQERITKSNIENTEESIMFDDDTNENSPLSSSSATALMYRKINARKKSQTQPTQKVSVADTLEKYLASRPATTTESGDQIHSFLRAMADSVKALPPDLQLKAKNKIYSIVSELEYENLQRTSTNDSNKQLPRPNQTEFSKSTSISLPQDTHGPQGQMASDNFEHHIDNTADENLSTQNRYIIMDGSSDKFQHQIDNTSGENISTQHRYIIMDGSDSIVIPQEFFYKCHKE